MGKKPKNSDNTKVNSNADPSSGSASSTIFQTLFGAIPEQPQTSVSLFSEANPFRRKPINDLSQAPPNQENQQQQHKKQQGLGFGSAEDTVNTTNGEGENPNLVEVKNRKRKTKDKKKPGLDTGSIYETEETRLEIKKSKKGEPKGSDFGVESEERGENPNYVEVKKRKRNKEKKKPSLDSGSVDETEATHLEISRSKKGEPKGFDTGAELEETGKGKNPNLGMELEVLPKEEEEGKSQNMDIEVKGMEKKKKKKRKRDEVEAGYEARLYGVVGTDNGGEEQGGLGEKVVGEKRKKVDDPVDLVVKEGFDDEAKLGRTVFVGNLPLKVKKKALVKEFSQYGEVESVRIRSVPLLDSKIPRKGAIIQKKINGAVDSVHAYIVFKTEQPAQASLAHNMAVVGGNHIRVDRACPPRKKLKGEDAPLYDNNRTVFVGNLPFDVKDEEIYQFFSGFKDLESSIEAIRVIRDPGTSLGKGIAYILFKTRGAANLVVKKRSLKLRDRELRLCHAKSDRTPSKRTNPSPIRRNDYPTKLAVDSRTPNSNNKANTKAAASYQGLRGSKSGVQKKVPSKITEAVKFKSRTQKGEKPEVQKGKRLAVAARKARVLQGGGASKQTGKKRKMEIRTPESARLNKKTKKFR